MYVQYMYIYMCKLHTRLEDKSYRRSCCIRRPFRKSTTRYYVQYIELARLACVQTAIPGNRASMLHAYSFAIKLWRKSFKLDTDTVLEA